MMRKSAIFTMAFVIGLSLSACGNTAEEVSNMETTETAFNIETAETTFHAETVETTSNAETETASLIETETVSSETESLESQEVSIIEDESVVASGKVVVSSGVTTNSSKTNSPVSTTKVSSESKKAVTNSTSDVNPDGSLSYEDLQHRWTTGTTWKASNGIELKINDAWADAVKAGDIGSTAAIWYEDPDRDPTPNSPYEVALAEFIYGTSEADLNGKDRYNT